MNETNQKTIEYYDTLNYPINIVKDEEGSYLAEYPDLKGCITVAPSASEAIIMAEDAKKAWLETAFECGIDIPEPRELESYSGTFKLRIPRTLHKSLVDTAKREGISMNQLCVYILSRELEKVLPK